VSSDSPAAKRRDPVIEAYRESIDLTLVRENLRRTPEERLRQLQALQRYAAELRRAGDAAAHKSR
jgi:hypothetical protein